MQIGWFVALFGSIHIYKLKIQIDSYQINPFKEYMAKNMLGITPYYDQFYGVVLENLRRTLTGNESIDNIEIEIKYAEFKNFSIDIDQRSLKDIPNSSVRERIMQIFLYQRQQFFKSLQTISKQQIINLNPLGRNTYQLTSGFDQQKYKKFYHIRDFLNKICQLNHANNYQPRAIRGQKPINIYQQLSLNANGHLLLMKQQNQIRMDLYIKELAPEGLRGRYSYSNKIGWKKTQKAPLCPQVDFMLNQRTFRFAINRQIETQVDPLALQQIAELLKKNPKVTDIRLKKLMRVNKGSICEYALSEIYNINEKNNVCCPLLLSKITCPPSQLNEYLNKVFINFYTVQQKDNIKFEIQSEFSKQMTQQFKKLIMKNRFSQVKHEIQSAIQQLYSFYFCDHITKVKQIPWLNKKCYEMSQTRLENQYGNYMRQEIYQIMKKDR